MTRRLTAALAVAGCAAAMTAAGCGGSDSSGGSSGSATAGGSSKAVKVALVLNGPKDDGGWNTVWLQSVAKLQKAVPNTKVTTVPNISPGADLQRTAQQLAQEGNQLVVLTGGYTDSDLRRAARNFPDTKFVNAFGTTVSGNVAPFDVGIEEGRYLDGVLAGSMTKSGTVGEVGGYPVPIEVRALDAFALGVKSVNPKAKVRILWVNSYYDPGKERQAAQALADAGADVLVMDSNTPAVSSVARARGRMLVGYGISREKDAPKQWLGSFTFDWSPYLIDWTKAIQSGSWKSQLFYLGIKDGAIGATPFGASVPDDVRAKLEAARKKFVSGETHVFTGPIHDKNGKEIVPAGATLDTPKQLNACCTWLLDNVEGNLGQAGG
jgi:basic membrane protein A